MIDHYVKDGLDDPIGETAMGKRLSDDPGLAEIKRLEAMMGKAPCLARLNDLADWSEGKD